MLIIGTSGWQYSDWRGPFYPPRLPRSSWLDYYARQFGTVEINTTFYGLPNHDRFASWRQQSGEDFCFAVKMNRTLTHTQRLRDPAEIVASFLHRAAGLGDQLGPVLLQLPPSLSADQYLLAMALEQFPPTIRVAVEFRHPSWWTVHTRRLLEEHAAALVWADRRSRLEGPLWRTADWGYLRMHEGRAHPHPTYGPAALRSWLSRITENFTSLEDHDVYVYFNNDPTSAAVDNATTFARQATRRSMPTTRHP
jgi:uncharacterized protein YecE (DUF72 family)